MPSTSRKMQQMMGIAHSIQQGKQAPSPGTPSAKVAATVPPATVAEFATTSQQGLPMTAPKPPPVKRQVGKMGPTRVTKTGVMTKKPF